MSPSTLYYEQSVTNRARFLFVQVAEFATQFFITDNKCNCAGIVLAGSAEFKHELQVGTAAVCMMGT